MQSPAAVATLMRIANRRFRVARAEDLGQDLLEYGLLAALIAIVALGAVSTVGQTIYTVFWQSIAQNF
jgi:Flp pilus assembly pilin Flp